MLARCGLRLKKTCDEPLAGHVGFELQVVWIESDEVVEVSARNMVLETESHVRTWRDGLMHALEKLHASHGRLRLLICIDDVKIFPRMAPEYGRVARTVTEKFACSVARYGRPSLVRSIISAEAVNRSFPVNLFESRDLALEFLTGR